MDSKKDIEKRFIEYKIRGLIIKPVNKSPFSEEVYRYVKDFLDSNDMKIIDSLLDFGDYAFSNISSKESFLFIQIYNYFAFIVDDHLERFSQDFKKFIKYVNEGECKGNTQIERFLQFYFIESKRLMDEEFLRCHNKLFLEWLQFFPQKESFDLSERSFTDEEFINMRIMDGHTSAQLFIYTLDCGLKMNEEIERNENYIGLYNQVSKHGILINDLFSFIKESEQGLEKFNYVYVVMKNNSLTVEQAMDRIVEETNESERMAHFYANKLIDSNNKSLANYAKKVVNIMYGNAYWSAKCPRYKNPEYKFYKFDC